MNKNIHRLTDTKIGIFQIALGVFAAVTFLVGKLALGGTTAGLLLMVLAAVELASMIAMLVYLKVSVRSRRKELSSYIESLAYDTESAKSSTLLSFPMPMAVFRNDDTRLVWGNGMFFDICGEAGTRLDAKVSDFIPGFNAEWIAEGKTQYPELIDVNGHKYRVHGNTIHRDENEKSDSPAMCVTYWIDVTEYEKISAEYEASRPVAGILVIDNYEEMTKNLPDREKNDVRDAIEDKLFAWAASRKGTIRRYDRDRYIVFMEKRDLEYMKHKKFPIIQEMHSVESPNGFSASISLGLGEDAQNMAEAVQFADIAAELALSRGGDQAVIKNRLNFDFFGGRGGEVEKRTKVRSRVMANTVAELIKDSSQVFIMGHRYADLDSLGAAVGLCCLSRKLGVRANIVVNDTSSAELLVSMMKAVPEYKNSFYDTREAIIRSDGRTLLVIVDTNRPEQIEDTELLNACSRVAVIDHHRVSATYIHNAALGFVEPYASSTCELVTELLQETVDITDIIKSEADALLAGIVLDTKNFTIRTGERTFDAASYLRRSGADPIEVKKLLQSDMSDTIRKYRILQNAELYRDVVAIASPEDPVSRIVAAKAADELLNISGVEASIVVAPGENGGVFASARSIGELNVQIIMEKLGGGGNRSAAAAQLTDKTAEEALELVHTAVDEYLG
ncbi:MAG: DHH family phosphoesterase [Eubacteriales bacterium]|nr:DHH family phosphoesterase [Eubacteriales bacterium]